MDALSKKIKIDCTRFFNQRRYILLSTHYKSLYKLEKHTILKVSRSQIIIKNKIRVTDFI
jgi:hypothetical protein